MVKKLFKQEMISYSRNFLPMVCILLGIAFLNRIIQFFESDSLSYDIVFVSSVVALSISAVVCLVMAVVIAIKRYYTNFFTSEGYLTFTLPATNHQLILTKLLCAGLVVILSFVSCLAALFIATSGEVLVELFKAFGYVLKDVLEVLHPDGALYIIEVIVLFIIAILCGILLFYTCITVGQMAKKNRVAAAFGVYFGYYLFTQLIGTIFIIIFTSFYEQLPIEEILRFFEKNPHEAIHIVLCSLIVFYAALGSVYYFISSYIIRHKLNLE